MRLFWSEIHGSLHSKNCLIHVISKYHISKAGKKLKMFKPSLTAVMSVAFLAYMANSLWSIASLYLPPSCDSKCLKNGIEDVQFNEGVRFLLMLSDKPRPSNEKDLQYLKGDDLDHTIT